MMLVQKQPLFSMALAHQSPFLHTHRRHPSAPPPIVQVQPTRTPGLLSLSRPAKVKEHKASPRPKPAQAASRSPKPAHAEAAPPRPTQESRGRQHPQSKRLQQPRSASQAAPARRRQPSPDPFSAGAAPQPTAAAPPPNKRRSPHASTPIPVPALPQGVVSSNTASNAVSRSDPVLSHMPHTVPRRRPTRTATLDSWDQFPVCDDTVDLDVDSSERPSTPSPTSSPTRPRPALRLSEPRTPTRRSRFPEPPRTAPLSSATPGAFPFPPHANASPPPSNNGASPHASPKRRADRRAKHLSEGVVLPPLFPFVFGGAANGEQRRSRSTERSGSEPASMANGTTLFASSMFQNSPSPEELPPPSFV
ncbi:hypothetical protein DFH06DRAFT_622139 [Mycena polygramma]|nr:hypothetical protein DFH06DRAFT_622139 [Mycena polygramma]